MPCWSCFSLCLSHSALLNAPSYLLHPAAFFFVCLSLSLSSAYPRPLTQARTSGSRTNGPHTPSPSPGSSSVTGADGYTTVPCSPTPKTSTTGTMGNYLLPTMGCDIHKYVSYAVLSNTQPVKPSHTNTHTLTHTLTHDAIFNDSDTAVSP